MILQARRTFSFSGPAFGPAAWGTDREWLMANGIGGHASQSLAGINTKPYHGLFVRDRRILIEDLEERIEIGTRVHRLSAENLALFEQNPLPVWIYQIDGIRLKKSIFFKAKSDIVNIGYELMDGNRPVRLLLQPFMPLGAKKIKQNPRENGCTLSTDNHDPVLHLYMTSGDYQTEESRRLGNPYDLFSPGSFSVPLSSGEPVYVIGSLEQLFSFEPENWRLEEEERLSNVVRSLPAYHPYLERLALSADAIKNLPCFFSNENEILTALPGFFLVTGKHDEAKEILRTFAAKEVDVEDENRLWLFEAVYRFFQAAQDKTFVLDLFPLLDKIVDAYWKKSDVENEPLWHNALKIMEAFSPLGELGAYSKISKAVAQSYQAKALTEATSPRELFALSLSFPILAREQSEKVFRIITEQRLTPYGLRFEGSVHPWFLGPYLTALVRFRAQEWRKQALELLSPILTHLSEAGIGSISEKFSANFPYEPLGSPWHPLAVSEILRAYLEVGLGIGNTPC